MCSLLRIILTAAIALCACAESHATLVKWTLNNVTFFDGGKATGFFIVDTDAEGPFRHQDYDIKTTAGLVYVGHEYAPPEEPVSSGFHGMFVNAHDIDVEIGNTDLGWSLRLAFDADLLHTTSGTFHVLLGCNNFADRDRPCSAESVRIFDANAFRPVFLSPPNSVGTVTATVVVPEPTTFAFLALALGSLVIMMRKRAQLTHDCGEANQTQLDC